jgi:hypothetical protein
MTAELGRAITVAGVGRGVGPGRGGGMHSFAERREAAQRRLSSSARAAEVVDVAMRAYDELSQDLGVPDATGSLRAGVRALLGIAYTVPGFDVTLIPTPATFAVRVRHTLFGPEAEISDLGTARPANPSPDSTKWPAGGSPTA